MMRRRFPLTRRFLLLMGDTFFVLMGFFVAYWINLTYKTQPQQGVEHFVLLVPIMVIAAWFLLTVNGLLSVVRMVASQVVISVGVTVVQLSLVIIAASFWLGEDHSRTLFLLIAFFQFLFLTIWKYCFWRFEKMRLKPQKVLIIGDGEAGQRITSRFDCQMLSHFSAKEYCLTGVCDQSWMQQVEHAELVILAADVPLAVKDEVIRFAHEHGVQAAIIPDFYELFCFNVEFDKYDDIPVFRTKYLRPTMETRLIKRMLDISISLMALLGLWPVFILVGVAVKLDSPGPILYSQIRTGEGEKDFRIYKFRTMRKNAEKLTGPVLATDNDPRITRTGKILRAIRLDELPQLVNVLMGDMSIVGPRPERPVFVAEYNEAIPNYRYRHNVKPGITGYAQVFGKYNTVPQDKLIYDLLYIQKCSLLTDLMVILQTVRILLIKDSTAGVTQDADVSEKIVNG